jgi:hypothetical protein
MPYGKGTYGNKVGRPPKNSRRATPKNRRTKTIGGRRGR